MNALDAQPIDLVTKQPISIRVVFHVEPHIERSLALQLVRYAQYQTSCFIGAGLFYSMWPVSDDFIRRDRQRVSTAGRRRRGGV